MPKSRTLPALHLRPFFTPEREPCWLLLGESLRKDDEASLRNVVTDYARAYDRDLAAWRIDHGWEQALRDALSHSSRTRNGRTFCPACAQGGICAAWQRVGTHAAGYRTRHPRKTTYVETEAPRRSAQGGAGSVEDIFANFRPDDPDWWDRLYRMAGFAPMDGDGGGRSRETAAALLGLTLPATTEQIQIAFKAKALANHPDRGGTDAAMREVIAARDTLLAAVGSAG